MAKSIDELTETCRYCKGSGEFRYHKNTAPCRLCNGTGYIRIEEKTNNQYLVTKGESVRFFLQDLFWGIFNLGAKMIKSVAGNIISAPTIVGFLIGILLQILLIFRFSMTMEQLFTAPFLIVPVTISIFAIIISYFGRAKLFPQNTQYHVKISFFFLGFIGGTLVGIPILVIFFFLLSLWLFRN